MEQVLSLPPEYREPLLLRCVRSMTYLQISEMLDLPVTTIETRLARARRMLRDEVGQEVYAE
jgi:RNA polymerase sigma-70 factor (ECF subfamily)